jgi:hypothetical protein
MLEIKIKRPRRGGVGNFSGLLALSVTTVVIASYCFSLCVDFDVECALGHERACTSLTRTLDLCAFLGVIAGAIACLAVTLLTLLLAAATQEASGHDEGGSLPSRLARRARSLLLDR